MVWVKMRGIGVALRRTATITAQRMCYLKWYKRVLPCCDLLQANTLQSSSDKMTKQKGSMAFMAPEVCGAMGDEPYSGTKVRRLAGAMFRPPPAGRRSRARSTVASLTGTIAACLGGLARW